MQNVKHYPIDWNGETRALALPTANIAAEIKMTGLPPVADPWQAIVDALENPIGAVPIAALKPGSTVALLTGDRFTDQVLGPRYELGFKLLDYLNRLGIRDQDVTLVYASGSHPSPKSFPSIFATWHLCLKLPTISPTNTYIHNTVLN